MLINNVFLSAFDCEGAGCDFDGRCFSGLVLEATPKHESGLSWIFWLRLTAGNSCDYRAGLESDSFVQTKNSAIVRTMSRMRI
jgi:hypothetical protein